MSSASRNVLLVLLSGLASILASFAGSFYTAQRERLAMWLLLATGAVLLGQIVLTVCVRTREEWRLATLEELQDKQSRTKIEEMETLSAKLKQEVDDGNYKEVRALRTILEKYRS